MPSSSLAKQLFQKQLSSSNTSVRPLRFHCSHTEAWFYHLWRWQINFPRENITPLPSDCKAVMALDCECEHSQRGMVREKNFFLKKKKAR